MTHDDVMSLSHITIIKKTTQPKMNNGIFLSSHLSISCQTFCCCVLCILGRSQRSTLCFYTTQAHQLSNFPPMSGPILSQFPAFRLGQSPKSSFLTVDKILYNFRVVSVRSKELGVDS